MSSAEATVEHTVRVHHRDAPRSAVVLALLAFTQLTWLGALVYGAVWVLT